MAIAGKKLSADIIAQMRDQYANGDSLRQMEAQYDCCRHTIMRHCRGVERQQYVALTTLGIGELLARWKPVVDSAPEQRYGCVSPAPRATP